MLENIPFLIYVTIVFFVGMFFSFLYWLEHNIEKMTKDNRVKKTIRGMSHSAIGAFVGITVFVGLHDFYPEISRIFGTFIAGIFAIMVDLVLFILKSKGERL